MEAHKGATHLSPGPFETQLRLRLKAKEAIIKSIVEHRLAVANNTRVQKLELGLLEPNTQVDVFKIPDRKEDDGWKVGSKTRSTYNTVWPSTQLTTSTLAR